MYKSRYCVVNSIFPHSSTNVSRAPVCERAYIFVSVSVCVIERVLSPHAFICANSCGISQYMHVFVVYPIHIYPLI